MLCINANRKTSARIHMLISLLLVIVCTAMAFMPLIKIVITESASSSLESLLTYAVAASGEYGSEEEAKAKAHDLVASMKLEDEAVTMSLFGAAQTSDQTVKLGETIANFFKAESDEQKQEAISAIGKIFLTDDGKNLRPETKKLLIVISTMVGPVIDAMLDAKEAGTEPDMTSMLASAAPALIGLLFALLLMLLLPIIYAILALVALITTLKYLREPVEGAAKLAKRMPKALVHPLVLFFLPCVCASFTYTTFALVLLGCAAGGTLLNLIFTRLHSWDRSEIAYANVVQLMSLLSIGAFVFFFINLLNAGVFASFLGTTLSVVMGSMGEGAAPIPQGFYLDAGLVFGGVFFALCSVKYLAKASRRLSLACKPKKKGGARACHLVYALFMLLATGLPTYALKSTANNGGAFLVLTAEQSQALFYGLIATAAIVVIEIVLLILRKVFGKNLSPETTGAVLSGTSD